MTSSFSRFSTVGLLIISKIIMSLYTCASFSVQFNRGNCQNSNAVHQHPLPEQNPSKFNPTHFSTFHTWLYRTLSLSSPIPAQANQLTPFPIYAKNDLYTNSNAFRVLLLLVQFIACMLGPFHTFVLCARCRLGRPPRDFIPYFLRRTAPDNGVVFRAATDDDDDFPSNAMAREKNRRQYVIWCA